MTWGNNGAGPLGVPPIGPPASVNSPMVGQAGSAYPAFYGASFESVMAAVSRGEVSLNAQVAAGTAFSGNNAAAPQGNPTLLQAISQGNPQNGTNGLNGKGESGGTVNSGSGSVNTAPGIAGTGSQTFGGTHVIDPKQVMSAPAVALVSPLQYGGN